MNKVPMRSNFEKSGEKREIKRYFRISTYPLRIKFLIALIIFSAVSAGIIATVSLVTAKGIIESEQTLSISFWNMVRNIGLWALLVVIFAALAAIPLSSALTAPIRRLMSAADAITSGNKNARANIETEDEFGVLAGAINQMTNELQQNLTDLEQRVSDRTRDLEKRSNQLQAVAEIGRAAATLRNVDELLSTVTHLISERFGFYHTGIFLVEEQNTKRKDITDEKGGRFAVLRAANSDGGQRMLARGHKLRVGEQGIVGYVTGTGNPRIALDVGEDSKFFNNPDLPETRSEMALALSSGGKIIGALDVQSIQPNAFSREDATIMQTLADLVAIAIENARLFRESKEALETSRRIYGEVSRRSWMEILNEKAELSYTSLDYPSLVENPGQDRKANEGMDGEKGENIERVEGQGNYPLSLPIKVRETVIGYLDTFKPKESGGWTPEEYDMVTTIIEQLGVALESARLYEASQLQAERERLVSEVASRMRESLDVDAVLRTAVQELRQSLGILQVEVRLNSSQQDERG
jgi:GAF domain-containing protein/HAMP domain-containing protein